MAYERLNLADGDVLKAEHLGHMEDELEKPKSWNDLTDKPFGEARNTILPLGEVNFLFDSSQGGAMTAIENAVPISAKDKLEIIWDAETYTCALMDAGGMLLFGNLGNMGMDDTGEPFMGAVQNGMIMLIDATAVADVARNVAITALTYTTIPANYFNCAVTQYYFTDGNDPYIYMDSQATTKVTTNEMATACFAGIISLRHCQAAMRITPLGIYPADTYMMATCDVRGETRNFYTAEYVPETT